MMLVAVAKVLEVVTWLVAVRVVGCSQSDTLGSDCSFLEFVVVVFVVVMTVVSMDSALMFVVEKAQAVIPSRSVVLVFVVVVVLVIVLCGACWW